MLTLENSTPSKYRLLRADPAGVTFLRVTDPTIPAGVAAALGRAARIHPSDFFDAQAGRARNLNHGVRIAQEGVFQNDRRLFDLNQVMAVALKEDVVEVSVMAKHVGSHARRGALIGAVGGALLMGIGAATCSSQECDQPLAWAGLGAFGGAIVGLEWGTLVGLFVPRSPNLVYRR